MKKAISFIRHNLVRIVIVLVLVCFILISAGVCLPALISSESIPFWVIVVAAVPIVAAMIFAPIFFVITWEDWRI